MDSLVKAAITDLSLKKKNKKDIHDFDFYNDKIK